MQDTLVILEEGNPPHPRCPDFDMFPPWVALNRRHHTTSLCAQGAEYKRRILDEEEERKGSAHSFTPYNCPLDMVYSLRYLGRTLM